MKRVLVVCSLVVACGGGGDGGGPMGSNPVIAKAAGNSGDGQNGTVGQPLADSFRVVVTQDGVAKAGVNVNWSTLAQGASLSPASLSGAGPRPPAGTIHQYVFQVFALDNTLMGLETTVNAAMIQMAMMGHVVAAGSFTAPYTGK